MYLKSFEAGDLSKYNPYRDAKVGNYEESDLVVLNEESVPIWIFVKIFVAFQESGAGAIGVTTPEGVMVAWSRVQDAPVFKIYPHDENLGRLQTESEKTIPQNPPLSEHLLDILSPFGFSKDGIKRKEETITSREPLTRALWDFHDLLAFSNVDIPEVSGKKKLTFQKACESEPHVKTTSKKEKDLRTIELWGNDPDAPEKRAHFSYVDKQGNEKDEPLNDWTPAEIRAYFSGAWFEEYVYLLLNDARSQTKKKKGTLDFVCNPQTEGKEVDVVAYDKDKKCYYVLECKARKQNNALPDFATDLEAKVETIRSDLDKERQAIGVIVYLSELPEDSPLLDAVKASKSVACIHGERLKDYLSSGKFLELEPGQVNP